MERIKGKFGFGCMRPPMQGEEVDLEQFRRMVDAFLGAGFNYFDTARPYVNRKSEPALRECLTSRYPRESYVLADKLSGSMFQEERDIRPLFESQLAACGVEYFDFYLMHAQSRDNFERYKRCRAYETALALKEEGRVRHVGLSFHDTADVLDRILTEYPQVEAVQLQLNYLDWDDPSVQAEQCWQVCRRHGKPVIVMEPVKGGKLAVLPEGAQAALDAAGGGSPASYAIRYAAGLEGVMMVLSGMSSMAQMEDNLSCMRRFQPLDGRELAAIEEARRVLRAQDQIPCTACRYCVDGCPMGIAIPDLFGCLNDKKGGRGPNARAEYESICAAGHGRASQCVKCGKCEEICPQHLPVRELLVKVAEEFEG